MTSALYNGFLLSKKQYRETLIRSNGHHKTYGSVYNPIHSLEIISASMKNQGKPVPPFIGLAANYDPAKNAIVENVPSSSVRSNETPHAGKTEAYEVVRQVLDDEEARRSTETRSNRSLV